MTTQLPDYSDAERATWVDFLGGAPPQLQERLGIALYARGEHLAFRVGVLSHLALNRLIGLYLTPSPSEEELDAALRFFHDAGERRFLVQLPVGPEMNQLRSWLEARDLAPYRRRWVRYQRDAAPISVPRPEFPIDDARVEERVAIGKILCAAFDCGPDGAELFGSVVGRPGWCVKVARSPEGSVMGVGMMFLRDRSAYLAFGATDPAFRRRGVQGALMATRVQVALDHGCTEILTETGEEVPGEPNPSGNNMLRCGFRPVLTCDNWAHPGTTWLPP